MPNDVEITAVRDSPILLSPTEDSGIDSEVDCTKIEVTSETGKMEELIRGSPEPELKLLKAALEVDVGGSVVPVKENPGPSVAIEKTEEAWVVLIKVADETGVENTPLVSELPILVVEINVFSADSV